VIRFHLDEHVDHAIALGLRSRGIDVTTAADAMLLSANDDQHLAFALREGRVLVTNDSDYLRLAASGVEHAGIAYLRPHARTIGYIVRILSLLHDTTTEVQMRGQIEYL